VTHYPSNQGVLGALSLEVKVLGRDADKLTPSSAEVKNGGAVTQLPCESSLRGDY
jgi:hypothetical protein